MDERQRRNEAQLQSLQQFASSTQLLFQESAQRQTDTDRKIADTDRKIDALQELVKKLFPGTAPSEATERGEIAITKGSQRVDSVAQREDANRIPTPRADPTTTSSSSEFWERHQRIQENLRKMASLVQEMQKEPYRSEDLAPIEVADEPKSELIDRDEAEIMQVGVIANPIEEKRQEINEVPADDQSSKASMVEELKKASNQTQTGCFKVNSDPCVVMVYGDSVKELGNLVTLLIEWMKIRLANKRMASKADSDANMDKVCEKMPNMKLVLFGSSVKGNEFSFPQVLEFKALICNWGGWAANLILNMSFGDSILLPYDRGKRALPSSGLRGCNCSLTAPKEWANIKEGNQEALQMPFDRGKKNKFLSSSVRSLWKHCKNPIEGNLSCSSVRLNTEQLFRRIFVFPLKVLGAMLVEIDSAHASNTWS